MPAFNTANAFDYGLIALYFAIVVWVGLYSARKNKSTGDYFRGGGKIPWFLAGMSNWVAGFSAFMFVAAAGFTYKNGLGALLMFTSAFWAYLVGYFYFAKMWRRARIDSPLEFLTRRYSPSTTYFYSVTAIIPSIVGIGQGLYILCLFVSSVLGFADKSVAVAGFTLSGFQLAVVAVGAVMVFYTAIGGLWAAVLSDAVQCIILAVMSLIIFPLSFMYLGHGSGFFSGVGRLLREAPPGYFTLQGDAGNPWFLLSFFISTLLGYNVAWALVQRYHSVADERGAKKMALLCAVLSLVGPLLWILPVMAARVIFPDMKAIWPGFAAPEEASFVSLALLLLPHGMLGFVVSAILSAALGQANDTFNWLAATVTHDLYVPYKKWRTGQAPTDQRQLRAAHITMVLMGACGVAVAFYIPRFGGAFQFALHYYSLVATFSVPVALGMMYRKTPWWSGIASCSAALGVVGLLILFGVWKDHAYVRNMLVETSVATLVFFASARWYRADDPRSAGALRLDADLKIPVIVDEKVAVGSLQVYGVIGSVSLLLGVVLVACWFIPSLPSAPGSINVVAGILLLALGGWLRRVARRAGVEPGV
jgi:Na+/proline symporter